MRAVFNEPEIRETVLAGLEEILYGYNPKAAIVNLLTWINEKLQESQSVEEAFDVTLEEAELFNSAVEDLRIELFDKRKIYEVIKALLTDDQLRDQSVDKVTAIVYGPNPKEALFDALDSLSDLVFIL